MKYLVLIMVMVAGVCYGAEPAQREFAIDLWDWTTPCRDLATFSKWCDDFASIGGTRMEISAPWAALEPAEDKYDLSFVRDRLKIARSAGLGLRVRINSYYAGATPAWLKADHWRDAKGGEPKGTPNPVSICDERFLSAYEKMCRALARSFAGEDVYWSAFIGVHAELKWSDWWTFDPSSLAAWRKAIARPRPAWLRDVVGDDVELPETPPVPRETSGAPDLSAENRAFIAFREHAWRAALLRFNRAIRQGDPHAKTSAPLGESYRRLSARMSNLDYAGLSRGFDQVVHSYDFFWHTHDEPWNAAAAVASFRGITRLPVVFEFDGPALTQQLGYTPETLLAIADAAIDAGAGIKVANYSYSEALPSSYPLLKAFGEKIRAAPPVADAPREKTVLLFVSKWANYCYREKTEWFHDQQFAAWKKLVDQKRSVKIICEDNLDEDLSGYAGLCVTKFPREVLPAGAREKLGALEKILPAVN